MTTANHRIPAGQRLSAAGTAGNRHILPARWFVSPHLQGFAIKHRMITRLLILPVLLSATVGRPLLAAEYRLISEDPPATAFSDSSLVRSAAVIDDAALRDAASVGQHCWAVGDHGVILRSADAGVTWTAGILPFECSLNSVCFLTSEVGFAAGLRLDAYSGTDQGVLLMTRDGGETWTDVSTSERLPGLRYVRFFGFQQGIVITTPTSSSGGTVLLTKDGGLSWKLLPSDAPQSDWVHADFLSLAEGLLVGNRLSWGLINNDQIQTLAYPRQTLQAIRAVSMSEDGRAWLAGDGGFLRRSTNRGVSWKAPAGRFPSEISDVFRFSSVVHDGNRVCVAGTPAASVLHSSDSGTTWTIVPCAERGSIHRLIRVGPDSLLAVGSWGMMMKSDDFGRTWSAVRHGKRRSSLLYLVTDPQDTAPLMLGSVSAEDGYRVSVLQPSQKMRQPTREEHWRTALSHLGSNSFISDWRFPRTLQLHHLSRAGLLQEWQKSSDGRLRDLLPLRLAVQIRTWQPAVICIESSGERDGVASIWDSVISTAAAIASGSDPRSATLDSAGLLPWTVPRILQRSHRENTGVEYQADTLLPRMKTTTGLLAGVWYRQTADTSTARQDSVAYAPHRSQPTTPDLRKMFQGLSLPPDSAGRRALTPLDPGFEELQAAVSAHHTRKLAVAGHVRQHPLDTALISHTQTIGRSLPQAMAKEQLLHMLSLFRQRENLECRIAVQQELSRRFPNSPEAAQAVEELHLLYSSAELLTLRKRDRPQKDTQSQDDPIELTSGARPTPRSIAIAGLPQPATTVEPWVLPGVGTSLDQLLPTQGNTENALDSHWNEQAETAWTILKQLSPAAAGSAEQLLIQAARRRRLQQPGEERILLSRAADAVEPQRLLAANEMQTTFMAMEPLLPDFKLPKGEERPQLDGLLSDVCWQDAPEIRLTDSQPGSQVQDGLIMLSWDEEFLFLAGRLPLATPDPAPEEAFDRRHDEADITTDHIEFRLDVDRDYSSSWHFIIDSAGRTSDRCWQIARWNPEWFVATHRDRESWRFEAAIPIEELQEQPLTAGDRWAVSIQRVVPGFADQRVATVEEARALNDSWSIIRFIRNRRPR